MRKTSEISRAKSVYPTKTEQDQESGSARDFTFILLYGITGQDCAVMCNVVHTHGNTLTRLNFVVWNTRPRLLVSVVWNTGEVEIRTIEVNRETDQFVILASNGLWDVMTSEEAVQYVHSVMGRAVGTVREKNEERISAAAGETGSGAGRGSGESHCMCDHSSLAAAAAAAVKSFLVVRCSGVSSCGIYGSSISLLPAVILQTAVAFPLQQWHFQETAALHC